MNTILHTLSALLSGAFLNLGLVRLAERLDPVDRCGDDIVGGGLSPAVMCVAPCYVPEEYSLAS